MGLAQAQAYAQTLHDQAFAALALLVKTQKISLQSLNFIGTSKLI